MGQKRKSADRGRKHGKRRECPQNGAGASKSANGADMDDNCVHYASGGEEENGADAVLDAGSDGDSGDSGDDMDEDEAEAELALGDAQNGESDVEVTLDFYDPREGDRPAIATFLDGWVRRIGNGLRGDLLSQTICAQTRVGTTVRVEDDDAPVGFISCLNVRRHAKLLAAVRKRLSHSSGELAKTLNACFDTSKGKGRFENEKMGLILTERVVNLPPPIIPKLLEALFCEVEWAVEDEPTEDLREDYRFGWYLYITEAFTDVAPASASNKNNNNDHDNNHNHSTAVTEKSKKKKQKTTHGHDKEEEQRIGFVKVEDEAWFTHATDKIMWDLPADPDRNEQAGRKAIAMLIAAKHVPDVRKMVDGLVGGAAQEETNVADPDKPEEAMES